MKASATLVLDRQYFELFYDDWLRYRAKWQPYAVAMACLLTGVGIAFSIVFREQWLVGLVFGMIGVYELWAALTHWNRWIRTRLTTRRIGQAVEFEFSDDELKISSSQSSSTIKIAALEKIVLGDQGVMLIPDSGVSWYVPETAFRPAESYSPMIQAWINKLAS